MDARNKLSFPVYYLYYIYFIELTKNRNSFFFKGVLDLSEGKRDRTNKENTKENEKRN